MARIKTERVVQPLGGGYFQRVVNFSVKTGKFSCPYPQDVAAALAEEGAVGDSVEAAEAAWTAGCTQAGERSQTITRVIVIDAALSGQIERDGKVLFGEKSHGGWRNDSLRVQIDAGVFDEVCIKLGDRTTYRYDAVPSSIPEAVAPSLKHKSDLLGQESDWRAGKRVVKHDRLKRIPWSKEAEAWTLGLVTALENVVLKLETLRRNEKALQASIDKGRGLLTAGG